MGERDLSGENSNVVRFVCIHLEEDQKYKIRNWVRNESFHC